jgi:site-specific DNA recombinase
LSRDSDFFYNQKNSRTGKARDQSEWVRVSAPAIICAEDFEAVQARLASNHPKITPPRTVNSPTLLAGIGVCGHPGCGAGLLLMTG